MTTITLPPDLEGSIAREAHRRGIAPETLALDGLRRLFAPAPAGEESASSENLFDFLAGHIGTVSGTMEALSERCGDRFADAMVEKHGRGCL